MNRFQTLFAKQQHGAFLPYFMLGYPSIEDSLELIRSAIAAGADGLELGLPFSDPIADGTTIQQASSIALNNGMNLQKGLALIAQIRAESDIPIALMTYFNLIFRQGIQHAHQLFKQHGVDALITVDLPLGALPEHEQSLIAHELGSIHLITPNTPLERAQRLMQQSTAFSYIVSQFGTTGSRQQVNPETIRRLQQLRILSDTPMVVGFGVSSAEHVQQLIHGGANGVIIASAIINLIEQYQRDRQQYLPMVQAFIQACSQTNTETF